MGNLIDLELHKFEKLSASYAERLRRNLEQLQSTDVSKLNGRALRKLRDRILNTKWLILACDPETREQITSRLGDSTAPKTLEEWANYVPEPPTVSFL